MNLYFDIETIPGQREGLKDEIANSIQPPATIKKTETLNLWYEEKKPGLMAEKYRKTSLNGAEGEIICLCWAIDDGPVRTISRTILQSEAEMLIDFFSALRSDMVQPHTDTLLSPIWVGHYICGFDLPFLYQRCVVNNIRPTIDIPHKEKPWGKNVYDTRYEWLGDASPGGGSLDKICRALGLAGKGDIDGSKVWDYVLTKRYKEIEAYCRDDVAKVRALFHRYHFTENTAEAEAA